MGFLLSLPRLRLQLLCLCMGGEWLSGLEGLSTPGLVAGGQPPRAGQCGLPQLAWVPTRVCRDAPGKTLIPFWVVNGAPSCPPGQVWLVRCPGQPHVLGRRPCWWGWGWGRGVPELSFTWQQFVIDMHLQQENRVSNNNNKRAAFAFVQLHFGDVSPVRCSGRKFHMNELLVSPGLLINSFPVFPSPPPTKPQLYGAGMQFRT